MRCVFLLSLRPICWSWPHKSLEVVCFTVCSFVFSLPHLSQTFLMTRNDSDHYSFVDQWTCGYPRCALFAFQPYLILLLRICCCCSLVVSLNPLRKEVCQGRWPSNARWFFRWVPSWGTSCKRRLTDGVTWVWAPEMSLPRLVEPEKQEKQALQGGWLVFASWYEWNWVVERKVGIRGNFIHRWMHALLLSRRH